MLRNRRAFKTWVKWACGEFNITPERATELLIKHEPAAQNDGFPTATGDRCTDLQKMRELIKMECSE